MNTWTATINNIGGNKFWQVFKPQAGGFCLALPELPWLNDLIRLADLRAYDADGVFQGNLLNRCVEKPAHKAKCPLLFWFSVPEPAGTGNCEIGAGWMSDHDVPAITQEFKNIPPYVKFIIAFTWKKITRPEIVSMGTECITDNPGEFTGNETFHDSLTIKIASTMPTVAIPTRMKNISISIMSESPLFPAAHSGLLRP